MNSKLPRENRTLGPEREDKGIGLESALVGQRPRDAVAVRLEPGDGRAGADFALAGDDLGRQGSSEFGGLACLVGRTIDPAGNLALCRRERRFERDHPLAIEHLDHLAVGLEQLHVLDAPVE